MNDPFDAFRLNGRTALVTGARREIGRAIALILAGAGARVAVHHAGSAEEAADAAAVVAEIEAGGGEAAAFGQDFAVDDAGLALAAAVNVAESPAFTVVPTGWVVMLGATDATTVSVAEVAV